MQTGQEEFMIEMTTVRDDVEATVQEVEGKKRSHEKKTYGSVQV